MSRTKPLIGWREWVLLPDISPTPIKAKIDTGARTSALHAFGLRIVEVDGVPHAEFECQPIQRSRAHRIHCSIPIKGFRKVRSSTGHSERRPVVGTRIVIGEKSFPIDLTLTSRDDMGFRMLIGRSALRKRFLVDPGTSFVQTRPPEEDR